MSFVCQKRDHEANKTLHGAITKTKVKTYLCKIRLNCDVHNNSSQGLYIFVIVVCIFLLDHPFSNNFVLGVAEEVGSLGQSQGTQQPIFL